MKITVTGAAGRLGKFVVNALHAGGHQIVATDKCFSRELPVRVEILNLSDPDGCYRLMEGSEAVVHLGNQPGISYPKPQGGYTDNVTANVNVFQAAHHLGVGKIVYASSIQACSGDRRPHVRGGPIPPSQLPYLPLDGHLPANPGTLYGASKVDGENLLAYYAKFQGLSTVAIRFPFLMYLPQREWDLLRIGRDGAFDEGFSFVELSDAAALITAIVNADLPGFRIYLPSSIGTTLFPMPVEEIVARFYPNVPRRPQETLENLVDLSEITRDTGWVPQFSAGAR